MDALKIGSKLVSLRGDKSQQEVSKAVGISPSALSMYERGERVPRDEIKKSLADYYSTTVQALFYS